MADEIERKMRALTEEIRNSTKPKPSPTSPAQTASGNGNVLNTGTIVVTTPQPVRHVTTVRAAPRRFKPILLDAIRARAVELAMTEQNLLEEAQHALRRPVMRLESLTERQLGLIYSIVAHRRRPALE